MVERQICFEFAALFPSPIRAIKKGGNFKINLLVDQMVLFFFGLCFRHHQGTAWNEWKRFVWILFMKSCKNVWIFNLLYTFTTFIKSVSYSPLWQNDIYRPHTVNSKKTRTPCFSTLRFSRISPEPLDLQKIYLHMFISIFEELSVGTRIFQIRWHNQLILAKH